MESGYPRQWFFAFTVCAGIVFIGLGTFTGLMIFKYHHLARFGYTTTYGHEGVVVATVDPDGTAAGKLQPGDSIIAINGDPRYSRVSQVLWRPSIPEGATQTITVWRNGAPVDYTIDNGTYPAREDVIKFRWRRNITYFPRFVACLGLALLLGLVKPWDWRARLGSLAFFMIAHQAAAYPLQPIRPMFTQGEDLLAWGLTLINGALWFGPTGYHASYRFLPGIPTARFWTFLQRFLYSWGAIVFVQRVLFTSLTQSAWALDFRYRYYPIERVFSSIENWYFPFCLICITAVLARNSRVPLSSDEKRRVRIVIWGTLLAILPVTAVAFTSRLVASLGNPGFGTSDPVELVRFTADLFMFVIPLSWGYAILKRQVYDVDVVVRRSVQYLLAKNALQIFLVLPLAGVLVIIYNKSDRTLRELLGYLLFDQPVFLVLTALAAISLIFRSRLRDWIDRRFFREAYHQDKILHDLSDEVRKLDSISEMSRRVSQKVDEALHPEHVYLFYRSENKGELSLGYSTGGGPQNLSIPEDYELLRMIAQYGRAVEFPLPQKLKVPPHEAEWLSSMKIGLVVPLMGSEERLAGLLLLGPKRSDAPYSGSDRELLDALANQIALVYENIALKDRVARDRKIQHEVLARVEERKVNLLKECPRCGLCYDSTEQRCGRDATELVLTLPVDRTVAERYRLERLLGRGGMGSVYEATDFRLHREVAVKILGGGYFGNPEALRRFQREAQASARLRHPNIAVIYDYGLLSSDGAYLVMELLKGHTLGDVLRDQGCIEPSILVDWFDQILAGMVAAHEAGIVHRDLKPDNIFVGDGPRPQLWILDFGIARVSQGPASQHSNDHTITAPGAVLGTIGYMSPEQLTGKVADERADIFSLGVILVTALTGRKPFEGQTIQEIMTAVLSRQFHLHGAQPEIVALDRLLQKCLAKDRNERFSSIVEMQRLIVPAIRNLPEKIGYPMKQGDLDTSETRRFTE
jgi:eukaryotic-like serine/threonine-protein kinase